MTTLLTKRVKISRRADEVIEIRDVRLILFCFLTPKVLLNSYFKGRQGGGIRYCCHRWLYRLPPEIIT